MGRSKRVTAAVAALVIAVSVSAAAQAPVAPSAPKPVAGGRALSTDAPLLHFAGQMHNPTPLPTVSDPDPTVCVNQCQLWALTVRTKHRFLVSVHNGNSSIDDGFNLYVYDPAGDQVASANGIGSNGQAVVITPPTTGVYTIAVTVTYAYDANASYVGEARLMARPTWDVPRCAPGRACELLPALSVRPPADVHIDGVPPVASTPLGFPFPVATPTGNSCYVDETARTGAQRCLRFTSEVDNVGRGPLTLQIPWAAASPGPTVAAGPGMCHAQQVILRTDGTTTRRAAGPCEFHAAHAHFHYKDFVEYSLHKVNADGTPGKQVAFSLKESFCLADDGYFGFASPGPNGPRTYVGQPDCNVPSTPTQQSPDALITMGITPGWGDIYTWDTPDQFIDISLTPPGIYDIVSLANPAGMLKTAGRARTCAATRIRLTNASVKVLDPDVSCS